MIETALNAIISPILAALTPAVPFYWGRVPSLAEGTSEPLTEYVSLSGVFDGTNQDDDGSDNKQLNIVTRASMSRAKAIDAALRSGIQRYKGVVSGIKISSISHVRSVEIPDATIGEDRIAAEYHVNYEGGIQ